MAGPNLELFKFGLYLFFPLAVMVHYGDPQWYHDNVLPFRDAFWPAEDSLYKPPRTSKDVKASLEAYREERRARRAATNSPSSSSSSSSPTSSLAPDAAATPLPYGVQRPWRPSPTAWGLDSRIVGSAGEAQLAASSSDELRRWAAQSRGQWDAKQRSRLV